MILILFHGNAAVERSFSFNREFLTENLKIESLIAQRCVHDAVRVAGSVKNVVITKNMIKAFSAAHRNRKNHLEHQISEDKENELKRKRAADEINDLRAKRQRLPLIFKEGQALIDQDIARLERVLE
ncbi:hypothetical protein QAD02_011767 [Eretmocerus hayati]|uniref:Uncharacterized protein n=1 Tax=Eretmocerus hayati TaxID=131215 RepID=A0ACC2NXV5_9HYME|nr:hypothetical protein QAD02_011767 [Eretmocerus hayati]